MTALWSIVFLLACLVLVANPRRTALYTVRVLLALALGVASVGGILIDAARAIGETAIRLQEKVSR